MLSHTLPPILDYNAPGSLHQKVLVPLLFSDARMDFFHSILRMKLRVNKLRLHLSSEKKGTPSVLTAILSSQRFT